MIGSCRHILLWNIGLKFMYFIRNMMYLLSCWNWINLRAFLRAVQLEITRKLTRLHACNALQANSRLWQKPQFVKIVALGLTLNCQVASVWHAVQAHTYLLIHQRVRHARLASSQGMAQQLVRTVELGLIQVDQAASARHAFKAHTRLSVSPRPACHVHQAHFPLR